MGQYFKAINLDKEQAISPYGLGSAGKLIEILASGTLPKALVYVLRDGVIDGGGDLVEILDTDEFATETGFDREVDWEGYSDKLDELTSLAGSWAGDDVRVVGDYNEDDLYSKAKDFEDITEDVRIEINRFLEVYGLETITEV